MDIALIEDAEHDIDDQNGGENEKQLVGEQLLELTRRAFEGAVNRARQTEAKHRRSDCGNRITQGFTRREIERDSRGHKIALMIYRHRRSTKIVVDELPQG